MSSLLRSGQASIFTSKSVMHEKWDVIRPLKYNEIKQLRQFDFNPKINRYFWVFNLIEPAKKI